jgi:alcohol dehydrogenase class IV
LVKTFSNPVDVINSNDWFCDLEISIKNLRIKNPIIVTSIGRKSSLQLDKKFNSDSIYANVSENPNFSDCKEAFSFCDNKNFDSVIAIGGGSVMDISKAIMAFISSKKHDVHELIKCKNISKNKVPAIFLPTTHGTGSEVTMWGTIWNMEQKKKYSISNSSLYPDVAILDPSLTLSLPLHISIITAMDALSHSFESIWNVNSNPTSTSLSIEAITLILQNIFGLKSNPSDISIRNNLLIASNKAGLAFSNTKTAAAHSISYPLTIYHGIPHGIASSITLIELLKFNKKAIKQELNKITKRNNISFDELITKID